MFTFIEHLLNQLDTIKESMFELLDKAKFQKHGDNGSSIISIAPANRWGNPTKEEEILQIKLIKSFKRWREAFLFFTEDLPENSKRKIEKTNNLIISWIEKKQDYGVPGSVLSAKTRFEDEISIFYDTLKSFAEGNRATILIPDTNALIQQLEPIYYKLFSETDAFTIIYLPTVLSELDELKIKSSKPEFQTKVKAVIKRLKGYRQQGDVLEGVITDRSITHKMIAVEPNFERTLSWLKKDNNDDKIIASVLEIQRENPSAIVKLVTSDMNLQNKAAMAGLPYCDID
ncbi:MAG: hypothetical protein JNM21_14930 [Taibaiella sp.]|nr:hypothetical protein [Taibaiella sp.]